MSFDFMKLISDLFVPEVSILEKIIRPILVYFFLILLLRVAGQRTLSQMNAFDLVVLLTLSNTVQNAIIGQDNSLFGGFVGATTLILINLVVVRFLYRHQKLDRQLEGNPIELVHDGQIVAHALEETLITEDELMAAIRRQGAAELSEVTRVILETSGTISVLLKHPTTTETESAFLTSRLDRIERQLARLTESHGHNQRHPR